MSGGEFLHCSVLGNAKTAWEGWEPSNHLSTYLIHSNLLELCSWPIRESSLSSARGWVHRSVRQLYDDFTGSRNERIAATALQFHPELLVLAILSQERPWVIAAGNQKTQSLARCHSCWSCEVDFGSIQVATALAWQSGVVHLPGPVKQSEHGEWHCTYKKSKAKKVMVNCESMTKWPPSESKDIQNPLCRIKETKAAYSFWTHFYFATYDMWPEEGALVAVPMGWWP